MEDTEAGPLLVAIEIRKIEITRVYSKSVEIWKIEIMCVSDFFCIVFISNCFSLTY